MSTGYFGPRCLCSFWEDCECCRPIVWDSISIDRLMKGLPMKIAMPATESELNALEQKARQIGERFAEVPIALIKSLVKERT